VGLAGKDKLHGIKGIVHYAGQTFQVGKQQMGTFVGGKTATETYHQGIGINFFQYGHDARGIALVFEPTVSVFVAYVLNQFKLELLTGFPNLFVADFVDFAPEFNVGLIAHPLGTESFFVETAPFAGGPGGHMNAVGNITYM